jgi:hypothetical protein
VLQTVTNSPFSPSYWLTLVTFSVTKNFLNQYKFNKTDKGGNMDEERSLPPPGIFGLVSKKSERSRIKFLVVKTSQSDFVLIKLEIHPKGVELTTYSWEGVKVAKNEPFDQGILELVRLMVEDKGFSLESDGRLCETVDFLRKAIVLYISPSEFILLIVEHKFRDVCLSVFSPYGVKHVADEPLNQEIHDLVNLGFIVIDGKHIVLNDFGEKIRVKSA